MLDWLWATLRGGFPSSGQDLRKGDNSCQTPSYATPAWA